MPRRACSAIVSVARECCIATALLFIAFGLSTSLATNFTGFVTARIVGGLAVGAAILIAPVYIAEISPAGRRGGLVSLNQLMIVIGISASFFSNWLLRRRRRQQMALDARRADRFRRRCTCCCCASFRRARAGCC